MEVTIFCGKGMSIKRYQPYFPSLRLVSDKITNIVICHSRGIDQAIKTDSIIIALDPSWFPINNEKVFVWANMSRNDIPNCVKNLVLYKEDTHYPYQIKRIRDQIVKKIV